VAQLDHLDELVRRPALAVTGVVILLTVAAAGLAMTSRGPAETRTLDKFSTLRNKGTAVGAKGPARAVLARMKVSRPLLLGLRRGYGFYRLDRGSEHCYGLGRQTRRALTRLVSIGCGASFPSRGTPLLAFTIVERAADGRELLVRAEGIAADGIVEVRATDDAGVAGMRARVQENLFSFASLPSGLTALVALDSDGRVVHREEIVNG
jgi:hypothetical protein